jgi:hypothetical protein
MKMSGAPWVDDANIPVFLIKKYDGKGFCASADTFKPAEIIVIGNPSGASTPQIRPLPRLHLQPHCFN